MIRKNIIAIIFLTALLFTSLGGNVQSVLAGPCLHSINNLGQVYDCCNNGDAASKTYNPSNGYCSRTCGGGTCYYDVGSGNWQPTSCNTGSCTPTNPPQPTSPPIPSSITPSGPTLSPAPTLPGVCALKNRGDATCDGKIDDLDFKLWLQEFDTMVPAAPPNQNADFACIEGNTQTYFVDLVDFEIWRRNTTSGLIVGSNGTGSLAPSVTPGVK